MDGSSQLYTFELWSSSGVRTADISALAKNRRYSIKRNDAESLYFELDLFKWEAYCAAINADPTVLLNPLTTEVKVKRGSSYLFGTQVISCPFQDSPENRMTTGGIGRGASSFSPPITVNGTGYLGLFKKRYVTHTYSGNERCAMAADLINQTQAATNGNVGVTIGTLYNTGITDTVRTYQRQHVPTGIQNLATLTDSPFDFAFDANKVFSTYSQIGAKRTDFQLVYGGPMGNVPGLYDERSGANVSNEIIGLGSGFGADQLVNTPGVGSDDASQRIYGRQEDIQQYNSVVEQTTLDANTKRDLALEKDLLDIPQITITSNEVSTLNSFLSAGDRIPLDFSAHTWFAKLSGIYRLEQMDVSLDDNDFETITLYFDNYAVDPNS